MALMDRLKNLTNSNTNNNNNGNYDDDYDKDYYDEFNDNNSDFVDDSDVQVNNGDNNSAPAGNNNNYQPASSGSGISLSGQSIRMKIVRPQDFKSATQIAKHLLNKETVFLNLENTNRETSRRLIDFLGGVAYSIDGTIKAVAKNAYVITPSNVDVGVSKLDNDDAKPAAAQPANEEETEEEPGTEFPEFN